MAGYVQKQEIVALVWGGGVDVEIDWGGNRPAVRLKPVAFLHATNVAHGTNSAFDFAHSREMAPAKVDDFWVVVFVEQNVAKVQVVVCEFLF
jgi:hypothetical protein